MRIHWNAKDYSRFLDLRTRPARDLLAAIPPDFQPKLIYDLGCGPGNSTILLKERWPNAQITGLDSSRDMLNEAQKNYPDLQFIQANIESFAPDEKPDLIFANASLQWLDQHEILIPKLLQDLNAGGAFAIQMPNNFHAPTHQVTLEILNSYASWRPLLKQLRYGILTQPFYTMSLYYDLLIQSGASSLQLWETEYYQEMENYQAIFDWVKGTGLRPVLSVMNADNQVQFSQEYIKAIKDEYPVQANHHILLNFRRLFMVGNTKGILPI